MKKKSKSSVMKTIIISSIIMLMVMVACWEALAVSKPATQNLPLVSEPTADHNKFAVMNQQMKQGPDATKACLSCHNEAAKQVQKTIHWTWGKDKMEKKGMGKARIVNNF